MDTVNTAALYAIWFQIYLSTFSFLHDPVV